MAYTTPNDVREALSPEGSDTIGATAASLSDQALDQHIAEASAEVDAMVKGAPFPDGEVPNVVEAITRNIAAYLATLAHRQGLQLPDDHPVALLYKRAEAMLALAAAGKLDLTQDVETVESGGVEVAQPYEGDLFVLEDFSLGIGTRFLPPWQGGRLSDWGGW